MSDPAETASLYTQYTSKVEEDLALREKEHAELVARLALVERELDLLRKMKAVISSGEDGSSSQPSAKVPQEGHAQDSEQRETTAKKTAAKKTAAKKTTAKKTTAKKTTANKATAKKATAKKTTVEETTAEQVEPGPSRRQLILDYFAEVGQPRSSAEVTKELSQRHAEFTSSVAATREALEALVARGKLERTTQGRSVYYGPVASTSEGAEGAADAKEERTS
ncbi:histone H1-like repetitive region-containing protein [Streptomyces sp. NPDC001165]|uniref:histone H1-like repetitive region-containing protein n=1 Tax=Streptomyces sp. NPDC001165 TaxID=3364546 RepID=UPI0036A72254